MSIFWELEAGIDLVGGMDVNSSQTRVASGAANDAVARVHALERQIDKLMLVTAAMWSLLEEKGFTEAQLVERMKQIDLLDGVADGKIRTAVSTCSACGRTRNVKHTKCLYCGHAEGSVSPFGLPTKRS